MAGLPHIGGLPKSRGGAPPQRGEVSDAFLSDLAAWLHRDVGPDVGEGSVPKLLSEVERRCSSPLRRLRGAYEAPDYCGLLLRGSPWPRFLTAATPPEGSAVGYANAPFVT